MKKIFLLLFTALLFTNSEAQQVVLNTLANDGQEIPLKKDSIGQITALTAKQVQDTVFLCWKVQDIHQNGIFILYSSFDGSKYDIFGTKRAIGIPIHSEIAYYFKDKNSSLQKKYYKVIYISSDSEFLVSEKASSNGEKVIMAELSSKP